MKLIAKEDMKAVYTMQDAIEGNKLAYRLFSQGRSQVPLRNALESATGSVLFMPGIIEDMNIAGIKILPLMQSKENALSAVILLIDSIAGEILCLLDGKYLTHLRTAASAGAATDILANPDCESAALIGSGKLGIFQLEALLSVRFFKEIRIYSQHFENAEALAVLANEQGLTSQTAIRAVASSSEAVQGADVITVSTSAKTPVIYGKDIKKGAHINAIGSYMPDMQEVASDVLTKCDKIYFDSAEAVLAESGDLLVPMAQNLISQTDFTGELGQVIAGEMKGRQHPDEITFFKSVGIAVQDLVCAKQVYDKVLSSHRGQDWPG